MRYNELNEITVNPDAWTKDDAHGHISDENITNGKWLPIPTTHHFADNTFNLLWRKDIGLFKIILVDANTSDIALLVQCDKEEVNVMGGKFFAMSVNTLSAREQYRGKGLANKVYECLIENGQFLASSDTQSPGGKAVWDRLVQSTSHDVYALTRVRDALVSANKDTISKTKEALARYGIPDQRSDYHTAHTAYERRVDRVLFSGSKAQICKYAYQDGPNAQILVVPKGQLSPEISKHVIKL